MKNYNEIAESIFERREQYEKEKKSRKKRLTLSIMSICCACLVVLLGFATWQGGVFDKEPIQSAEDAVIPGTKDWYGPGGDELNSATQNHSADYIVDGNQEGKTENTQGAEDNGVDTYNNNVSDDRTTFLYQETTTGVSTEGMFYESYVYNIKEGEFFEYIGGKVINENKIGDKIAEVELLAGWKLSNDGQWLTQENLRGEVFSIDGVENDVAVALKFIDKGDAVTTTHFYVMINPEADSSAVKDYVIVSAPENQLEE